MVLHARAMQPVGLGPLRQPLSVGARLLYAVLADRSAVMDPRVDAEDVLDCGHGEALAAVHELVSEGWLAVRWIGPDDALAMLVSWPAHDLAAPPAVFTPDDYEDEA